MSDSPSISGSVPIKFAAFDFATADDHPIVAAIAGKRIRVIALMFVCAAAQTVTWKNGAGGTVICGKQSFAANGGLTQTSGVGLFQTLDENTALIMTLTTTGQTGGVVGYVEID